MQNKNKKNRCRKKTNERTEKTNERTKKRTKNERKKEANTETNKRTQKNTILHLQFRRLGKLHLDHLMKDGKRRGKHPGRDPHGDDHQDPGAEREPRPEREHDDPQPVIRDTHHGPGADVDRGDLDERQSLAQHRPQRPVLHQQPHQTERYVQAGDQEIRHGEVQDEGVGHRVHPAHFDDDMADEEIPEHGDDDDEGVGAADAGDVAGVEVHGQRHVGEGAALPQQVRLVGRRELRDGIAKFFEGIGQRWPADRRVIDVAGPGRLGAVDVVQARLDLVQDVVAVEGHVQTVQKGVHFTPRGLRKSSFLSSNQKPPKKGPERPLKCLKGVWISSIVIFMEKTNERMKPCRCLLICRKKIKKVSGRKRATETVDEVVWSKMWEEIFGCGVC